MVINDIKALRPQTGPQAKILASASRSWPQPSFCLVNLGLEKCAIQCKMVVSISWLCHCKFLTAISLLSYAYRLCKLSEYKDMGRHFNMGIKNQLYLVGIVAMCSYSEITCGLGQVGLV